jgi:HEAT repeat protein
VASSAILRCRFLPAAHVTTSAFAFGPPSSVDLLAEQIGHPVTIKCLGKILTDSDDDPLCNRAIFAAREFGADAKELVPQLIAVLESDRPLSKGGAACALREIGPPAAAAVPALIRLLAKNGSESTRCMAAGALGNIGLATTASIEALTAVFSSDHDESGFDPRWPAAIALGKLGGDARSAVPALIAALHTVKSPHVREAVAEALGRVAAPGDKIVISALNDVAQLEAGPVAVGDGDLHAAEEASVRIAAALAIWRKSHDRRVIDWLVAPLNHKNIRFWLREEAAQALGEIGCDAAAAVPALIPLVTDWAQERDDDRCSLASVVALGQIGPAAKPAIPVLIGELSLANDHGFHEAAAAALAGIGPEAREALPALASALECDEFEVRIAAANAIRRIGGDANAAVPVLIDCLAVSDIPNIFGGRFYGVQRAARVRAQAAQALGALGTRASSAAEALGELFDDDFPTVREAAADALRAIEKK